MPFIGFICDVNKKTRRMQNMWYVFFFPSSSSFSFSLSVSLFACCVTRSIRLYESVDLDQCLVYCDRMEAMALFTSRARTYINYGWKTELKLTHVIYVVIVFRSLHFYFGSVWSGPNSIWTPIKKGSNRQEFIESNIFPFITQCNLEW